MSLNLSYCPYVANVKPDGTGGTIAFFVGGTSSTYLESYPFYWDGSTWTQLKLNGVYDCVQNRTRTYAGGGGSKMSNIQTAFDIVNQRLFHSMSGSTYVYDLDLANYNFVLRFSGSVGSAYNGGIAFAYDNNIFMKSPYSLDNGLYCAQYYYDESTNAFTSLGSIMRNNDGTYNTSSTYTSIANVAYTATGFKCIVIRRYTTPSYLYVFDMVKDTATGHYIPSSSYKKITDMKDRYIYRGGVWHQGTTPNASLAENGSALFYINTSNKLVKYKINGNTYISAALNLSDGKSSDDVSSFSYSQDGLLFILFSNYAYTRVYEYSAELAGYKYVGDLNSITNPSCAAGVLPKGNIVYFTNQLVTATSSSYNFYRLEASEKYEFVATPCENTLVDSLAVVGYAVSNTSTTPDTVTDFTLLNEGAVTVPGTYVDNIIDGIIGGAY